MPRNRIIYQSLALFAGQNNPSGAHASTDINQLTRVQSWDSDFSRSFTDINQYGNLAAIDRIELEAPTVNMSTSWYPTDGSNEKYAGLTVFTGSNPQTSIISGILAKESDEKNYFLLISKEGDDAVGGVATGVIGLGNTFLTSYSLEGSVGEVPTASADFEALNFRIYNGVTGHVPAINPSNGISITDVSFELPAAQTNDSVDQITVIRPGDITVDIAGDNGFLESDLKIQSFSLSLDLARSPIEKLGSRFPYTREIDFPLTASMSVEAIAGDLVDFNLADLLCEDSNYTLQVTMKKPSCSGDGAPAMIALLKGAKLTSESVSTSIGDNATVSLEYEVSIGSAQQTDVGVFLSGSYV
jgi:hypothetical protein